MHILSMIDIVRSNVAGGRVADPTPHLLLLKTRPRMPWLVRPPKVMLLSPSPRGPLRQPLSPFVIQSHHPKKRQRNIARGTTDPDPVLPALVLVAPVLVAPVLAPVLQAIFYKLQCIASGTVYSAMV